MSASRPQSTVCVLGFGRSGTSLTMQILRCLGVELGPEEDMLHPHETDNPRGYWEPRWMVDLNEEILAALETSWWKPFPGEPGWEHAPALAPLRERAQALFAEKLGSAALSGWKDPRTTLTLPFWQQLVPNPLYVICIRNPVEAIASIQRRPEPTLSTPDWGEMWLEYTARALRDTAGRRRTIVMCHDYFRDVDAQIARLATLVGVDPGDARASAAAASVEQELRHHLSSPLELAATPGLTAPVRSTFLSLLAAHELRGAAADDVESQRLCDALERVAVDAWEASRAAASARRRVADLDALRARAEALELQLRDARAELTDRLEELQALRGSTSWRLTEPLRVMRRYTRTRRPGPEVT